VSPEELLKIWLSLASSPAASGLERRRIHPDAAFDLFACIVWPRGKRGLLIETDTYDRSLIRRLPKCKGVLFEHALKQLNGREGTEVRIVLEDELLLEIFAVLCADLLGLMKAESDSATGLRSCLDRMTMWQGLFDRLRADGLSPDEQCGLFGELSVLNRIHLRSLDPLKAVESWAGPDNAAQDFHTGGVAIEVKTSLAKRHSRLRIVSEKQLDERPFRCLFLVHVRLDESFANGLSLPQLVSEIRQKLSTDAAALQEFDSRLLKLGYLTVHEERYRDIKFSVQTLRSFHVRDNFPRLTETSLPPGVGDIAYSIIADDLSTYEVKENFVVSTLSSNHG
jgi:hypothetical protein